MTGAVSFRRILGSQGHGAASHEQMSAAIDVTRLGRSLALQLKQSLPTVRLPPQLKEQELKIRRKCIRGHNRTAASRSACKVETSVVRAARHVGRKGGKPVAGWWPTRIRYEERRRKGEAAVRGPCHPRSTSIEEHFARLRAAAIRSVRSIDKRFEERAVGEHNRHLGEIVQVIRNHVHGVVEALTAVARPGG